MTRALVLVLALAACAPSPERIAAITNCMAARHALQSAERPQIVFVDYPCGGRAVACYRGAYNRIELPTNCGTECERMLVHELTHWAQMMQQRRYDENEARAAEDGVCR